MDHVQRQGRALLLLGFVQSHIFRDEKSIFDLGRATISCSGEELDGDGLLELPEALDPLERRGRAAVLQHCAQHRNVLLDRGHGEVTVKDVTATLSLYSQVVAVVLDSSVAPLLDVNVSSASGNCDNVTVSIAEGEETEQITVNIKYLY